ncbi:MAG: Gfo/Idh/MocA family oxidoreductase [Victivallales bacterium]
MEDKVVRVAVVGLRHGVEHLDHYRGREDVETVGLCDTSEPLVHEVAAKYGAPGAACFTDYARMLREAKPDAVFVMTPVPFHAPMTIQALEAGCHVMVAKSLCRTLDEGEAMICARNKAGKHVEVGLQMHYAHIYRYLQEHLGDPEFGELRGAWIQFFYPSYWREPGNWQNRMDSLGGMLLDCCIHPTDVLLYVLNRSWTRVFASGRQFLDGPPERDTLDAATVLVDLDGGIRLTIDLVDSKAYSCIRTGVVGSTGKFEMDHWEPNGAGHVRFHSNMKAKDPVRVWVPPTDASTGHIGIVEQSLHFLEVCKGNARPRSSLESAMESLSLQMGIVQSLKSDRWVARGEITTRQYRK